MKTISIKRMLCNKNYMLNKKTLSLMFLLVLTMLIPLISAQENLGTFKQSETVQLVQTCSICDYVTLDSIKYPDGTINNVEENMTKIGSTFYYNFTQTSQLGEYIYNTHYSNWTAPVSFEINPLGKELTSAKATSYTIILIFSILIFIGLLYFGLMMPSGNKKDDMTGYILAVSNLKYLKHLLLALSYVCLIWISYFSWMIVYSFLDFDFLSNIFRFIFFTSVILALPLFILYVYLSIVNIIKDNKIGDSLMRGLRIK